MHIPQQPKPFSLENPVFAEQTKKARKYCLVFSLIALLMGLTGQVPSEILLLGVKFSTDNKSIIIWFFIAITAILFADFICAAIPDGIKYWAAFRGYQKAYTEAKEKGIVLKLSFTDAGVKMTRNPYGNDLPDILGTSIRASEEKTEDDIIWKWNPLVMAFCFIRILIEISIPCITNIWALIALWQLLDAPDIACYTMYVPQ